MAFRHNYECCVKVDDELVVPGISEEIDRLTRTEGVFYRNLDEIGRLIYPAPPIERCGRMMVVLVIQRI